MTLLASGSIAEDYIMRFHDTFGNYILPEKLDMLSVNFNIAKMQKHIWWAAHNICYNLALLEEPSLCVGAVGKEFVADAFNLQYIDYTYTHVSATLGTPSAHIITDDDDNQITAFYPGASAEAGEQSILTIDAPITYALVWPNNPAVMLQHLQECRQKSIPVIFDPGQPLSAFTKEMIHEALDAATYLIVNEYEQALLCKIAEIEKEQLNDFVQGHIVTLWADGAGYVSKTHKYVVDAVPTDVVDPTWAGDAFRAGVMRWLHYAHDWQVGMQLGSVLAHYAIQHEGTQIHRPTKQEIYEKVAAIYGTDIG